MQIVKDSTKNKGSRQGWKPDIIVCHITEGSYTGAVSWLKNPLSGVSAHFIVAKDGRVTQLVDIKDASWAQGIKTSAIPKALNETVRRRGVNPNLYCISIEHEGFYKDTHGALTPAQEAATVELIKYILAEVKRVFGIDIPVDRNHIIGHNEIYPSGRPNCPGEKFPFADIINKLKNTPVPAQPKPKLPNEKILKKDMKYDGDVKTMQAQLQRLGYYTGKDATLDGCFGPMTEKAVKAFQKNHKLETDGMCGPITWAALFN